ncbi:endonuclease [Prolixibacter bellariivorans]|uniref:Endonuclease n=1 Tax=Prolixibacter bellariivorans TaxID=314319 RepID=A0A5M4B330_9BACT|nr:HNH endonuclease [Prolixibacter bellariivorans]GET34569.1 endonuclease [Prolixibacter bellariivorans]
MPHNPNWSREEHIVAFNLYCKIPFTKINENYPPVVELANIIGRKKGAVSRKLANFARLDPALQARNVSGLTHGAKGEETVWNEFHDNWEQLAYESEKILAKYKGVTLESEIDLSDILEIKEGKERETIVKTRVNQSFFRKAILASYSQTCCITGIKVPELLIASHIIPWAHNKKERMNPQNGLCLNALHDKAFDKGLITITPDFKIKISEALKSNIDGTYMKYFHPYEGKIISLPGRFFPKKEFLEYHSEQIFAK